MNPLVDIPAWPADQPLRYAVVGTGALGGYYGACLQRAGHEVHFLVHRDYPYVRAHGLRVDSVNGDFHLPQVRAYADVHEMPPCDVILLALKTTRNDLLPALLPPLLAPGGVVLVLQNGLGIEEQVAALVGPQRVMGGLCFLCSNKIGPGHIRHLDYGAIRLGEYRADQRPAGISPRMERLAQEFGQAGIEIRLSEDLVQARWEKLVWNIPFNGLSVVLQATTAEMMADAGIRALAGELMEEVAAGAAFQERRITLEFIAGMLESTARMRPYKTSMMLDYEARQPLELAAIFAAPLGVARQAGLAWPRIAMLYRQLCFMDNLNRK
jgi:2-dehydropantoate 2-reductase